MKRDWVGIELTAAIWFMRLLLLVFAALLIWAGIAAVLG